jgi:predicted dehydrogenase
MLSRERLCQAALVCTPDALHYAPARIALELGYHLLLEKPISPVLEECQELAVYPVASGQLVLIAHVLRFTPFWRKVKEAVDSGRIGQPIHINLSENLSFWHLGHSYVRGNYGAGARSSPMILAKACPSPS